MPAEPAAPASELQELDGAPAEASGAAFDGAAEAPPLQELFVSRESKPASKAAG